MGIEPTSQAWEARILPMNYTRIDKRHYSTPPTKMQAEFFDCLRGGTGGYAPVSPLPRMPSSTAPKYFRSFKKA